MMIDTGCSILDTGYSILDTRCMILVEGFKLRLIFNVRCLMCLIFIKSFTKSLVFFLKILSFFKINYFSKGKIRFIMPQERRSLILPHIAKFKKNSLKLNGIKGQLNKFNGSAMQFFGTPENLKIKTAFLTCFRMLEFLKECSLLNTVKKIKDLRLIFNPVRLILISNSPLERGKGCVRWVK